MTRNPRPQTRRRRARPASRLEGLEARHLCSIGDLPGVLGAGAGAATSALVGGAATATASGPGVLRVVATVPASGQALAASPRQLTVTFNEPLQDLSLFDGSLALERLAADGTATPLVVPMTAALDRSGTKLIATLPAGALTAGHYELVLPASSLLLGVDGAAPAPGGGTLGDFTVTPTPGPSLAGAIDLGVPGATPTASNGVLTPDNPGGAALYKLTLPAGQAWTLGAAVAARGGGNAPGQALALFDASGQLLATAQPAAAGGTTLAMPLAPGTYYLGVSAAGNVPGTPGGYDPAAGLAGTTSQAGGPFRLLVGAVAGGRTATVQALTLNHADPQDPTPTGLTVQLAGVLGFAGTGVPAGALQGALQVVDASGRAWPLANPAAEQGGALVSFQFRDHLPQGHYTVILPPSAGLAAQAGVGPSASGQPAGVLGAFDVAAAPPRAPGDFGVITPGDALAGVVAVADLAPGASSTYRFVIESNDVYNARLLYTGGGLSMSLAGPGGQTFALDPGPSGARHGNPIDFRPGVYFLTLTAAGPQAVHVELTIQLAGARTQPELILPNGVGQAPAADLKLNATPAPDPAPDPASTAAPTAGPLAPSGALVLAGPATPTSTPTPNQTAAAGPALYLTPGGEVVGRPAMVVGRGESVGPGPSARDLYAAIPGRDGGAEAAPAPDPRLDGAIVAIAAPGSMTPRGDAAGTAGAGEAGESGWMDRLRQSLAALMPAPAPVAPAPEVAAVPPAQAAAIAGKGGPGDSRGEAEVEQAGIGPNLGIGLAAVLAAHVIRVIRRRRDRGRTFPGPRATGANRLG